MGMHDRPPPDVTGLDVIIVDFSYPREIILAMAVLANSILIIDHHKSACEDLIHLPDNITTLFNLDKSGCVLTWEALHPETAVPDLLLYIQDQDLHRFDLAETREVMASVFSYCYDFNIWKYLINTNINRLISEGIPIYMRINSDIKQLVELSAYRTVVAGHDVPIINAPFFYADDIGEYLGHGEPFCVTYYDNEQVRTFSLRSNTKGMDVSLVAAQFGGGGNEWSAGFRLPLDQLHLLSAGKS